MQALESLTDAENRAFEDSQAVIDRLRHIVMNDPEDTADAIRLLEAIRSTVYEDLNQIQHEYLILRGAHWLIDSGIVPADVSWRWNPRQTGTADEPDLAAKLDEDWLISAEATTSVDPQGNIDTRMRKTLENLAEMPGERFYFVRSEAMETRAETKIRKAEWDIQVVCFQ